MNCSNLSGPLLTAAMWVVPYAAVAQPPAVVNARVEISAAVAGSHATLEAIERQAASRDRARLAQIAALQTSLAEAEARGAAGLTALQVELVEAREALVADLASRDRGYAEEITVFRREVASIASTPEGAAALSRYNAGDRAGAIAVLDQLRRARDLARQTRANIESAAEARQIGILAMDARGRADPAFDTNAVIDRFEEVTRLDSGEFNDWLVLVTLYRAAGRSADALAAAERLGALAPDDGGRSLALMISAEILLSQGDRAEASRRLYRSLEIRERRSAADSASPDFMRDVSVVLERLGDLLIGQDDQDEALSIYQRSLEIAQRLSDADPASRDYARDVSVASIKIGDLLGLRDDLSGALERYEVSLAIDERLLAADPTSVSRADDLAVSLERMATVLLKQGDLDGALANYQRSLAISERLSAADPASADSARDVTVSLIYVGTVLQMRGDRAGALARFETSLEIRERLSRNDPASLDRARDVGESLDRIGTIHSDRGDRQAAAGYFARSLQIAEQLAAADPASSGSARDLAASCWKMWSVTGDRSYLARTVALLRDMEKKGILLASDHPRIAEFESILASIGPS